MSQQPEALRLADVLEDIFIPVIVDRQQAATELRRLYALNAELLEALKCAVGGCASPTLWLEHARAAIAKAEGETK